MSNKDKKARSAALRDFLVATPGVLDRAAAFLGWIVLLAGIALVAQLGHLLFGRPGHPAGPPAGPQGVNPAATLFVRDLGRLADGRHTFDLVYEVVLHNPGDRPMIIASTLQRLLIGDPPPAGDVVDLGDAPGAFGPATGQWRQAFARRNDSPAGPGNGLAPGHWRTFRAHVRINARPDQFADVAIGYGSRHEPPGWFGHAPVNDDDAHDEQVQLGAVLRAHCPLGVKVHVGEVRSLCAP